MASARLRWRMLREMDNWLTMPMAALSVAWLAIVIWELVSGSTQLLATLGTMIWIIFLIEFAVRFSLAPEKMRFLRSSWLTIIALAVPALRLFRAFAVLRAAQGLRGVQLVRIVGTANRSMNALQTTLDRRGFRYVLGLTVLVIGLGAAGMLYFEGGQQADGGFGTYGDALWWTGMLVASIGTGPWPVTTEGRILTTLLSVYGLAMFGYIAATFASFFIGRDAEESEGPVAGSRELSRLLREVEALRADLAARHPAS